MLDARRLRVLLAVQQHGGVAAAARALSFTPPAVSQQIAALERQVGLALLDREPRRARLTLAGERLAAHAAAVLTRMEEAEAELAAFGGQRPTGVVRIGVIPTVGRALLPAALRALGSTAPDLQVRVEQLEPEDSLPAVLRGDLDLAVASEYTMTPRRSDPRLDRTDLGVEPVYVAVPQDHPLRDGARLGELADQRWIAPAEPSSCFTMLQRACAQAGFEPLVHGHCADFGMALALVAASQGTAIVPAIAAGPPYLPPVAGVRLIRTRDPEISRTRYAVTRRGAGAHPGIGHLLAALDAAEPR
jgi:DNA-binding transcriptional LysR family regulator